MIASAPARNWTLATLLSAAAYVGFATWIGRFPTNDEVFFKAPGREWAATGRFAAPELTGLEFLRPTSPPIEEVWLVHPPGYPFAFGLFVKCVGFGAAQCVLFDALIHAALAVLTYFVARRIGTIAPPFCCAIALSILPIASIGRPDELAMCFGMAGIWVVLAGPLSFARAAAVGILLGLSAATFIGPAVMLGSIIATLAVTDSTVTTHRGQFAAAAYVIVATGLALIVLTLAVAPILLQHPNALAQFRDHVNAHVIPGNFFIHFLGGWEYEEFHRSVALACLLIAGLGLIFRVAHWMRMWAGPLFAIAFVAVSVPNKMYYLWFIGPWMIIAATATWFDMADRLPRLVSRAALIGVGVLYAVSISSYFRNAAMMLTLPESQSLQAATQQLRQTIQPGSRVVTDHGWWILAGDRTVFDRYFARVKPEQVDYIVLGGDGSGNPLMVSDVPALGGELPIKAFEMIENQINRQPRVLLGQPLKGTAQGFGVALLRRRKAAYDMMTSQER